MVMHSLMLSDGSFISATLQPWRRGLCLDVWCQRFGCCHMHVLWWLWLISAHWRLTFCVLHAFWWSCLVSGLCCRRLCTTRNWSQDLGCWNLWTTHILEVMFSVSTLSADIHVRHVLRWFYLVSAPRLTTYVYYTHSHSRVWRKQLGCLHLCTTSILVGVFGVSILAVNTNVLLMIVLCLFRYFTNLIAMKPALLLSSLFINEAFLL